MTSKMISIREDIYNALKRLKGPSESFSEVIEHLINSQKKDPLKHFGILSDLSEDVLDDFENAINEAREEDLKMSEKKFSENRKDIL